MLLTVREVSERYRCSTWTVRGWIRAKRLPAKRIGKLWRIEETVLEEMLRDQQPAANKEELEDS
jgi:excisionase family DNA binding protein